MIQRILVPLDGSELSARVLWQVRTLLRRFDALIDLYTVVESMDGPAAGKALKALERFSAQVRAPNAHLICEVEAGDPAERILLRAARTKPTLDMMTTHGRGGPSRRLRGSVAKRVLRENPGPTFLVNPSGDEGDPSGTRIGRILVPLDGSQRSANVLPLVGSFGKSFGSEVILLHVSPSAGQVEADCLERTRAELEAEGLKVRARVSTGSPAAEILEIADEEEIDLIAMATHVRSRRARWFSGSVTEKVLSRCPHPLLLQRT